MKDSTATLVMRILVFTALLAVLPGGGAIATAGDTTRASVTYGGGQSNGYLSGGSISADGRYVAFYGGATNLLAETDSNGSNDVFVHDRQLPTTIRVSVEDATGHQALGGNSQDGAISADGRYVAFKSFANDLVAGDTNSSYYTDVFRHDNQTGATLRVTVDSNEAQTNPYVLYPPAISGDGRYVAFDSMDTTLVGGDSNGSKDIFLRDCGDGVDGTTERISVATSGQPNSESEAPSISRNGSLVAFTSWASNLVSDDLNSRSDIFVRDRDAGTTERVSVTSTGVEVNGNSYAASISADGRFVAFMSEATDLVADDTNGQSDVFVHDRHTHTTTRVSVDSNGGQANNSSGYPSISAHGRYVAFDSQATNLDLVTADTNSMQDVFLHDRVTGETERVSLSTAGAQGNAGSMRPSIYSGNLVAFNSSATSLVSGDNNGVGDVFIHETDDVPDLGATVLSIQLADPNPTWASSVGFKVTFSAPVTDVQAHDFELFTTGLSGAAITGVTGSETFYVVGVNPGRGLGTLRLDVHDDDGILDGWGDPLGSAGEHNGNYTSGEVYDVQRPTATLRSTAGQDGWVLESGESTNTGGSLDTSATTLRLGDNAVKRQYRSVLSFNTGSELPDNAVITKATLKIRKQSIAGGGNPISLFRGVYVDVRRGYFGSSVSLQKTDFAAVGSMPAIGPFSPTLANGWYTINLSGGTFTRINKIDGGVTQLRLRFQRDDNNDAVANYLSFYSGNHSTASYRPTLTIEYHLP